ncbi:hypothetical protein TREMEDRAFT_39946, partial [Tremella mesenterica DSM 1558]|uniref:uncharacterized protein n=1 Tax=Tremella mesenterica (strain ATCC 24925 / CBS 8224 / DSM 1558 / NBRC 9311 / NRRL Y-6157 / RJB 2259-6 / UBC 559-6) TaxID=578456 RepID=UPI0003F4A46A
MTDTTLRQSPALQAVNRLDSPSPSPSPRRQAFQGPSSPRHGRTAVGRLPSITANDVLGMANESTTTIVRGFSPALPNAPLPPVPERKASSPLPPQLNLQTSSSVLGRLSPLHTPVEQVYSFAEGSPKSVLPSPRLYQGDVAPRSRRNSAAIVSIRLGSRSNSRTPRGSETTLPGGSGQATPSKMKHEKEAHVDMLGSWAPGVEDMEVWEPPVYDGIEEVLDMGEAGRTFTDESDVGRTAEDIMYSGMLFGEGREFQGEVVEPAVRKLSDDEALPLRRGGSEVNHVRENGHAPEKKTYQVIRQLGSGSYAVVYLVREKGGKRREYALKCLSKQNLEEEQLETQLFEATIHLALPVHPNIVTLHQTLQTKKWLFLMLELCPGEDLFYWLEKSRDASPRLYNSSLPEDITVMSSSKYSSSSIPFSTSQVMQGFAHHAGSSFAGSPSTSTTRSFSGSPASLLFAHANGKHSLHSAATPPTPSLLSAFSASTLLSARRLKLIASMFSQMCEAVAVCHEAGVSHRDIKPENFICCDSIELDAPTEEDFGPQAKRKVVVKLTDFGLATTEEESGDVECGSKPYMSYECRNNLGPTYSPAPADVWSLGIVLINMLFHRNPWKDPTPGDLNFDNFFRDPTGFLLSKFTGIGREVAFYLANHVLCIDVDARVSAREFGQWVKNLPEMIGGKKAVQQLQMSRLQTRPHSKPIEALKDSGMFVKSPIVPIVEQERKMSTSALTSSAPIASTPLAPHSLIPPSTAPPILTSHLSPREVSEYEELVPTPDLDNDELPSATTVDLNPTPADELSFPSPTLNSPLDDSSRPDSDTRSLSTTKRRKRGVRKGKAAQAALAAAVADSEDGRLSQQQRDALLAELATASQTLARDISKISKLDLEDDTEVNFPPLGTTPAQAAAAKKSKWKDMMKISSGNPELAALARRVAEREMSSGGNWSAPAKLQGEQKKPTNY